jgi:hypothetical protein
VVTDPGGDVRAGCLALDHPVNILLPEWTCPAGLAAGRAEKRAVRIARDTGGFDVTKFLDTGAEQLKRCYTSVPCQSVVHYASLAWNCSELSGLFFDRPPGAVSMRPGFCAPEVRRKPPPIGALRSLCRKAPLTFSESRGEIWECSKPLQSAQIGTNRVWLVAVRPRLAGAGRKRNGTFGSSGTGKLPFTPPEPFGRYRPVPALPQLASVPLGSLGIRHSHPKFRCEVARVSRQFFKQRLRVFQIGRRQALGEPFIHGGEDVAGLGAAPLVAAETGKVRRGAKLKEPGLLLAGDTQGFAIQVLGAIGIILAKQQFAFIGRRPPWQPPKVRRLVRLVLLYDVHPTQMTVGRRSCLTGRGGHLVPVPRPTRRRRRSTWKRSTPRSVNCLDVVLPGRGEIGTTLPIKLNHLPPLTPLHTNGGEPYCSGGLEDGRGVCRGCTGGH